jgi:hypothetical protein
MPSCDLQQGQPEHLRNTLDIQAQQLTARDSQQAKYKHRRR